MYRRTAWSRASPSRSSSSRLWLDGPVGTSLRALSVWNRRRVEGIVTGQDDMRPRLDHLDVGRAIAHDPSSDGGPTEAWPGRAHPGDGDPTPYPPAATDNSPSAQVRQWARGRQCVTCGGPLVESRLAGHHIALLEPSGMTREWVDVAADRLPLALATCLPMCWNCHVAATFRRMRPDLVTDRDDAIVHIKHD